MPPLDHILAFNAVCKSTLIESCNELATARTLRVLGRLALFQGSMRVHYMVAQIHLEMVPALSFWHCYLDWYEQPESALP